MTTPPTRFRLRDLAAELDIDTTAAADLLRQACAGHAGRRPRAPFGPSTVIGMSLAGRIRSLSARTGTARTGTTVHAIPEPPPAVRPTPAPQPAAEPSPTGGALFIAPGQPVTSAKTYRMPPPQPRTPPPSAPAAALPPEPDPAPDVAADPEWSRRGIEPAERFAWITAGLRPTEAVLAEHCRSAGIEPDQLQRRLSGQSALARLRGGEPAPSVWARLQEGEDRGRGPGRLKGWMT